MMAMHSEVRRLADQIASAASAGSPLRIRGGGSKDFYGQQLQGDLLDTGALRGIVAYEPSELVVTVRAGTPLAELEAVLAQQSQHLAFEPPHFGAAATVGGMVGVGLSGPPRAATGCVRDYVLGVQMLNGRAELLRFGGQVIKNVAGYDISRLMAGSMGTLGLMTEVSLKVLPVATAQATMLFELDQAQALKRLNIWAGQPLPLNASCWLRDRDRGCLYLRLRGARAAVESACRSMGGELQGDSAAADWDALREQTLPFFERACGQCLWRLSVPDSTGVMDLDAHSVLIEWGGALRWVKAPVSAATHLRRAASAAGGTATLFRQAQADGAPDASGTAVFHPLAPELQRIHRALKQQFDPADIFNRTRMGAAI